MNKLTQYIPPRLAGKIAKTYQFNTIEDLKSCPFVKGIMRPNMLKMHFKGFAVDRNNDGYKLMAEWKSDKLYCRQFLGKLSKNVPELIRFNPPKTDIKGKIL